MKIKVKRKPSVTERAETKYIREHSTVRKEAMEKKADLTLSVSSGEILLGEGSVKLPSGVIVEPLNGFKMTIEQSEDRKTVNIKVPKLAVITDVEILGATEVHREPFFNAQVGVWNLYRDGVTQSILSDFLLCPEKTRLASVEGLTPKKSGRALSYGSLVHDVLDQFYTHYKDDPESSTTPGAKIVKLLFKKEEQDRQKLKDLNAGIEDFQELEEMYGMAEGSLGGYVEKWAEEFHDVEWLALEEKFETPIKFLMAGRTTSTDLVIKGKRDGVYRSRKSGRLWLFETKTKGRISEDSIMDKLNYDLQVMLYLWSIWKDYGEVPGGVVYNIIRTPQLRQKKTENLRQFISRIGEDVGQRPEFYFIRYMSSIVESDLVKWEQEFISILGNLVRWQSGRFHYKNPAACSAYGVDCKFLSVCSRNDRSNFDIRETPFPELITKDEE